MMQVLGQDRQFTSETIFNMTQFSQKSESSVRWKKSARLVETIIVDFSIRRPKIEPRTDRIDQRTIAKCNFLGRVGQ